MILVGLYDLWGIGSSANEQTLNLDVDRRRVEAHREEDPRKIEVGRVREGVHVPGVGVMLKWGVKYDIARWDVTFFGKTQRCAPVLSR